MKIITPKSGQYYKIMKSIIKNLVAKISNISELWAITGGCNLYLKNCITHTDDIDIITNKSGVLQIAKIINNDSNFKVNKTIKDNVKSYFFQFEISGIKIEVMGEPENLLKGAWIKNDIWEKFITEFKLDNFLVPLASVHYELYIYSFLGNHIMVNKIKKCIAQQSGGL